MSDIFPPGLDWTNQTSYTAQSWAAALPDLARQFAGGMPIQALQQMHINTRESGWRDGFVRVVDGMGNDFAVEQAARISYGAGTRATSETIGLLEYMLQNEHTSPFEQAVIKFHVRAPIFVIRQWIRHRTWSPNELSARYSEMDDHLWVPQHIDLAPQAKDNKQGRAGQFSFEVGDDILAVIREAGEAATRAYSLLLGKARMSPEEAKMVVEAYEAGDGLEPYSLRLPGYEGLAREMARIIMPLNAMTELIFTVDLHNLLRFLNLRMDQHAQKEIRTYGHILGGITQLWTPISYAAFDNAFLRGARLTGRQLDVLRWLLRNRLSNEALYTEEVKARWRLSGYSLREFRKLQGLMAEPMLTLNDPTGATPDVLPPLPEILPEEKASDAAPPPASDAPAAPDVSVAEPQTPPEAGESAVSSGSDESSRSE